MNANRADQQQPRPERAAERPHQPTSQARAKRWGATTTVALVVGIGVVCLINGFHRVGQPFPGFLILANRIVVSIGRPEWSLGEKADILFAEVIGVDNRPVSDATQIARHVATLPVGSVVTYRFRKQARVFREAVTAKRFSMADYLAVYVTYFAVGMCFAFAGPWTLRRTGAGTPAGWAFFAFCEAAALTLSTGGDLYGPYWFADVYFTAFSLAPAALFHLAGSFPEPVGYPSRWRTALLVLLYLAAAGVAFVFHLVRNDASLFLPLLYTVYLLLANALLLYVARLLINRLTGDDAIIRSSVRRALAGVVLSGLIPGAVFVIYPALRGPISPVMLVAPLAIFPVLTGAALRGAPEGSARRATTSVRVRLSLLFLGPVETAFLIGVAVFWSNTSRDRLFDDFALNQRQQASVERFLEVPLVAGADRLAAVDAVARTVLERNLVAGARAAFNRGDVAATRHAITELAGVYRNGEEQLEARRRWLDRFAAAIVLGLIASGVVQAAVFMGAIRRWIILPIGRLMTATNVIATGDLSHRVQLSSDVEFTKLGAAINAMASSLGEIQRQVDVEQEARRRAAGAARDAERHRLARELHDSVLQDLGAIKLRLESECKHTPPVLQPVIDDLMAILVDLRRVIDNLRPPDLGKISLAEAIAAHAEVLTRAYEISLRLDLPPDVEVPDWAARDAYRIAQESISNAVRHAAPKTVAVRLYRRAGATTLEISDDGAGFDLARAAMGSGILGMRERAAALGAELQIITAPDEGTVVRLVLPASQSRPWRYQAPEE